MSLTRLPPSSGMSDTSATLAVLQRATHEGRSVWVGFVDASGVASQRSTPPPSVPQRSATSAGS